MIGRGENNTLPNRTQREQYPSYFYMASYQRSFPIYGRTRREQYPSYFLDGVVSRVVSHIW